MTIGELLDYAGPPLEGTFSRDEVGAMTTYQWQAPLDGMGAGPGWWWAVACGPVIFALGWTSGDDLSRNVELGKAVAASLRIHASKAMPS